MIEVVFYNRKYDVRDYGIKFETDNYELYEIVKNYIIEHSRRIEREEANAEGEKTYDR